MTTTKSTLRVGSADDADIVIKQPTVSRYHCELVWTHGAWQLSDLNSTNGTYVDGVAIAEPQRLSAASVVTLGRGIPLDLPPEPTPTPNRTEQISRRAAEEHDPNQSEKRHEPSLSLIFVGGGIAGALLLVAIGWFSFLTGAEKEPKESFEANTPVVAAKTSEKAEAPQPAEPQPPPIPRNVPEREDTIKLDPTDEQPDPAAYWAVVVESSDGKNQKLLGTAVAVGPNRLVTLASIAEVLESVKITYPKVLLVQAANPAKRLSLLATDVHPGNKAAMVRYQDFEKRLAEKISAVKEPTEPSLEESLEWSEQFESIMAEIARTDLAVLSVADTLDTFLTIGQVNAASAGTECVLRGYPMILPSPDIQANLSVFYLEVPAAMRVADGAVPFGLMAETPPLNGIPVISMVCVNQESQLIGLCVREEPVQDLAVPRRNQISPVEVFW